MCFTRCCFLHLKKKDRINEAAGPIITGRFSWPVFCSIGMSIMLLIQLEKGLIVPIVAGGAVSLVVTFMIAFLYHITFERLSGRIVKAAFVKMRVISHKLI